MPKKLPQRRAATADRIATLLRIHQAAVRAGDLGLRDASACELRNKYGIDLSRFDSVDLANIAPPIALPGGEPC